MPDTPSDCLKPQVGFIGTGIMGAPMAQHILDAGFPLTIWNRSVSRTETLAGAGARVVAHCADLLRVVDIAVCMLSSGPVVDEALFMADAHGIVPVDGMNAGSTLIVMSSIPVETCQRQARYLAGRGVKYLDAPVSGGEVGAKAGKLTIMAGGDTETIDRVRDLIQTMGSVTHVGAVGMGQLAKLANQMIVGITIGAVAEALLLAKHGGADLAAVRQALIGGFADSTVLRAHGKRMQEGDFDPGAPAEYQLKDLRTAQRLATELGLMLPLLSETTTLYDEMCRTELRRLDHSALYLYLLQTMTRKPPEKAS